MEHDRRDRFDLRRAAAAEIIDLRHRILRAGLPRQTAIFPGDDDPGALHFVAEHAGEIIGCVTLHPSEWSGTPAYQLRGMAVDPARQREGIGAALLAAVEDALAAGAVRQLWCNARTPAAGFYEKHGWRVVSEVFDIPSAGPHVKMIRRI